MKKIQKQFYWSVRKVLKSELNEANQFEAINTLAILVLTHRFTMINPVTSGD